VRELIGRYYAGVRLRRPIDRIEPLIDTTPITRLLGWRPGALVDSPVLP